MAGNQSRGLIAASKTKGWDPTVIPAAPGKPAQSLSDFDVDQGNLPGYPVGRIPGGPPSVLDGSTDPKVLAEDHYFVHPDYTREQSGKHRTTDAEIPIVGHISAPDRARSDTNRATRNANPFAGMGGE